MCIFEKKQFKAYSERRRNVTFTELRAVSVNEETSEGLNRLYEGEIQRFKELSYSCLA